LNELGNLLITIFGEDSPSSVRVNQDRNQEMNEVICFSGLPRPQHASELDPISRVAMIMEHAERLAEQASDAAQPSPNSPAFIRRIIAARAARGRFFDSELFADPAWDILLELYALRCEQRRTSVSKLCIAAGVPTSTALRWIEKLHKEGLIDRDSDPFDGRRIWVELSDTACQAMSLYIQQLTDTPMPI
jgi:DNA-binding MarR family transcriptional regulator